MNEQYIEELYERHADAVYRMCYCQMGNVQDACDALQNTFLKLIEHAEGFADEGHERAWLMKVAINECRQILRHWWRKTADIDTCIEYEFQQASYEDDETLKLVMGLPRKYRVPIYMYYYEGYSARDIGKLLHMSESAVFARLSRARRMLRDILEGEKISFRPNSTFRTEKVEEV